MTEPCAQCSSATTCLHGNVRCQLNIGHGGLHREYSPDGEYGFLWSDTYAELTQAETDGYERTDEWGRS